MSNNAPDYEDNLVIDPEKAVDLQAENAKLKTENKKLCKKIDELYENIDMFATENAKLEKLLKECRFLLSKTPYENMSQALTFNDVINRIDEVLKWHKEYLM